MAAQQPARLARSALGQREGVAAHLQHRVVLAPVAPAKWDAGRLDQLRLTVEMRAHQLAKRATWNGSAMMLHCIAASHAWPIAA